MTVLPWGRPVTREDLDQVPWIGANVELVDGTMVLTREHAPYSRADRDRLPEDGRRHELIDGTLVMTPAPTPRHQLLSGRLFLALSSSCPAPLVVAYAPLDVAIGEFTIVEPDLLVAPRDAFSDNGLPVAPLLAVEILSPSTRAIDLGRKRELYERSGVEAYWAIDPTTGEFIAWHLEGGAYTEVAHLVPGDAWTTHRPFAITIRPADLIDATHT